MLQYVEAELAKRRQASGVSDVSTTGDDANQKSRAPPAAASLWETPAALASAPRETEDSADRYLTGIVEVQLPAEVKFRNIEETERAKAELLKKQRRRDHRGGGGGRGRRRGDRRRGKLFLQLRAAQETARRRAETRRARGEGLDRDAATPAARARRGTTAETRPRGERGVGRLRVQEVDEQREEEETLEGTLRRTNASPSERLLSEPYPVRTTQNTRLFSANVSPFTTRAGPPRAPGRS